MHWEQFTNTDSTCWPGTLKLTKWNVHVIYQNVLHVSVIGICGLFGGKAFLEAYPEYAIIYDKYFMCNLLRTTTVAHEMWLS